MWLPDANERKLLKLYFNAVRRNTAQNGTSPFESISVPLNDVVLAFNQKPDCPPDEDYDTIAYIDMLNFVLQERHLIEVSPDQLFGHPMRYDFTLKVTPSGYDLGYKYSKKWTCLHLWWLEYKDSFIWPIIAFVVGSFLTYIITRHN